MRNLKKILALVLALVMSLSLMATASAADFKDASDINEKYETAIEVLEGLGVFKGYQDGTFQPTGSITRAETAAIIYRIVTGDVKDEQVKIYSDYNLFTDVPSTSWFAGYVNYCANAEYIKGVGGGKFEPNAKVTGYAALAMILRAIGYTANGGFTGPDWEVQTARTGEARKITKNILTGTLGENATRETVAEILFQAILVNMVDHNILNSENGSQGYFELDQSLGYKTFKLEELTGVVVANEFANLYGAFVLANDKTDFEVAKSDVRSLDIGTEITDIGESRLAYITGAKVLSIADTGLNKVTENDGKALEIETAPKFRAAADMNQVTTGADATQFYVNFGRTGNNTCDQRLEFSVTFVNADAEADFRRYTNVDIAQIAARDNQNGNLDNDWTVDLVSVSGTTISSITNLTNRIFAAPFSTNAPAADYNDVTGYNWPVRYNKIIRADKDISADDLAVLHGIFGAADNANNNLFREDQILGDVFVGTVSTNPTIREEEDLSNKISYNKFVADYLNPETYDVNWDIATNGDWVKFVDNDNDGNAEYAFLTESWLDEAVGTFTVGENTFVEYNWFNEQTGNVRYMDGNTPAVGDVVVCALIDGQRLVEPAKNVTKTVNVYNWRDDTITTTDNDTYGQSFIDNATGMQQLLSTMDEKTEYIMHFDHFGFVRAYELPGGTQYALLTEIYAQNNATGNVVQDWPMTVELKAGEAAIAEYNLTGANSRAFVALAPWTLVRSLVGSSNYYNWLQPAIAHLGVTRSGILNQAIGGTTLGPVRVQPSFTGTGNGTYTFWENWNQLVRGGIIPGTTSVTGITGLVESQEFDYGTQNIGNNGAPQSNVVSYTNVAAVNISDKNATLNGAAQLRLDSRGNVLSWNDQNGNGIYDAVNELPRYAVDYVQLTTADVVADQTMYPISNNYQGWQNGFVNATHDTEFYIVHDDGVEYFKDYLNMPALDEDNVIHAAYAVARDTSADSATNPYWVADVIVYEVQNWNDDARTSVSLVYFDQSRTTGQVRLLKTLNSTAAGAKVDLVPSPLAWAADAGTFGNFSGYGFYQVWNGSAVENGQMSARRITPIPETDRHYDDYGIYVGTVDRVVLNASNGGYITVNMPTARNTLTGAITATTPISLSVSDNVFSVTNGQEVGSSNTYNEANNLRYNNLNSNQVREGDVIIWQGTAPNTANWSTSSFIVDLGNAATNVGLLTGSANTGFLIDVTRDANRVANGIIAVTGAANTVSGEALYQGILRDQTRVRNSSSFNLVVDRVGPNGENLGRVTLANGVATGGNVTFGLANNAVADDGVTPTGMAPVAMTTTSGSITATGTTIAGSPGVSVTGNPIATANLTVTSVGANVTVTITYAKVNYTLSTAGNTVGVTLTAGRDSAAGTTLPQPRNYGDKMRLYVDLAAPIVTPLPDTMEVIVAVTETPAVGSPTTENLPVRVVDGDSFYADYEMPAANVSVTVTVQNKATDITVTENANITTASTTITGTGVNVVTAGKTARTTWGSDVTITPSVAAGYEVTGVEVTANNSPVATAAGANWVLTTGANGTANIVIKNNGACLNKAVVVKFTVEPIKSDLAFSFTGYTVTASVSGAGTITNAPGGGIVSGTTTIDDVTANTVITLVITGATAPSQVAVLKAGPAVVVAGVQVPNETGTSTNTWTYTITGVDEAGTITIA